MSTENLREYVEAANQKFRDAPVDNLRETVEDASPALLFPSLEALISRVNFVQANLQTLGKPLIETTEAHSEGKTMLLHAKIESRNPNLREAFASANHAFEVGGEAVLTTADSIEGLNRISGLLEQVKTEMEELTRLHGALGNLCNELLVAGAMTIQHGDAYIQDITGQTEV